MEDLLQHPIVRLVVILLAAWLVYQVYLLFKTKKEPPLYAPMRCQTCGWTGKVSRNSKKCQMCGSTDMVYLK